MSALTRERTVAHLAERRGPKMVHLVVPSTVGTGQMRAYCGALITRLVNAPEEIAPVDCVVCEDLWAGLNTYGVGDGG